MIVIGIPKRYRVFLVAAALLLFQVAAMGQGSQSSCSGKIPPPLPPLGSEMERAMKKAPLQPAQKGGKWGYANPQGTFLIAPQFDCTKPFSEGIAVVGIKKRFGYIDSNGRFVIPPNYIAAGTFKEGFAWVMTRKPWTPLGTGEYGFVARLGQGTFIDRSGREARRPFPIAQVSDFSE